MLGGDSMTSLRRICVQEGSINMDGVRSQDQFRAHGSWQMICGGVLMATNEFEEKARLIAPRNSRRNEIVAISLLAVGLLLTLCLVSRPFILTYPRGTRQAKRNA